MINGISANKYYFGPKDSGETAIPSSIKAADKGNERYINSEEEKDLSERIGAIVLKYFPYVLIGLLALGMLIAHLIEGWDKRNNDDDGENDPPPPSIDPPLDSHLIKEPVHASRGPNRTDVHGTALHYLGLHFMNLSRDQLAKRLHQHAQKLTTDIPLEARELLLSAEWEVAAMSKRIPIAFTAYLSRYWSIKGSRPNLISMILAQDSIESESYQQAALSHQSIIRKVEGDNQDQPGNLAAGQLHRLTASVLQAMEADRKKFLRPEFSRMLFEAAYKRLEGESFDLFPDLLQKYAFNQRSIIDRERLALSESSDDGHGGTKTGAKEPEQNIATASEAHEPSVSKLILRPAPLLPPIARRFICR